MIAEQSEEPCVMANANGILELIGQLGATGVLAWYCWYMTKTTLPNIVREFRAENLAVRQNMQDEYRIIREESRTDRERHDKQVNRMARAIELMVGHCQANGESTVSGILNNGSDSSTTKEDNGEVLR